MRRSLSLSLSLSHAHNPSRFTLVAIGATMGVLAFAVDVALEAINTWKWSTLRGAVAASLAARGGARGGPASGFGFYGALVAICLTLAGTSASLVAFGSPWAAGSGIPEVKAYLNGVHIPGENEGKWRGGVEREVRCLPPCPSPHGYSLRPCRPPHPQNPRLQAGRPGLLHDGGADCGQRGALCPRGRHRGRRVGRHGVTRRRPGAGPVGRLDPRGRGGRDGGPARVGRVLPVGRGAPRLCLHRGGGR